jgi:hypothetical protein
MKRLLPGFIPAALFIVVFTLTSETLPEKNPHNIPTSIEARVNTGLALLLLGGLMFGAWRLASGRSK